MNANEALGGATLRRVEWLTIVIGGLGVAWAGWRWGWRGALGLGIGALLSLVNFRWLKGGVQAMTAAGSVQPNHAQTDPAPANPTGPDTTQVVVAPKVPAGAFFKFFGRFALLVGVVYVILTRTSLPTISVFAGLFASTAGVVVGLVFELLSSGFRPMVSR